MIIVWSHKAFFSFEENINFKLVRLKMVIDDAEIGKCGVDLVSIFMQMPFLTWPDVGFKPGGAYLLMPCSTTDPPGRSPQPRPWCCPSRQIRAVQMLLNALEKSLNITVLVGFWCSWHSLAKWRVSNKVLARRDSRISLSNVALIDVMVALMACRRWQHWYMIFVKYRGTKC